MIPIRSDLASHSSRPYLGSLTTLRFIASFGIFILHARDHGLVPAEALSGFDLSQSVTFFFVLSGFVLSYAYTGRYFSPIQFYKSRFARVWPAFFLSIIFLVILLPRNLYLPAFGSLWLTCATFIVTIFGLQSWFPIPSIYFAFNAVTWSISVELFFYFCYPFLHKLKTINIFCLYGFSLFYSFAIASHISHQSNFPSFSSDYLNHVVSDGFMYINPLLRLPEFLLGIISFRLFSSETLAFLMGILNRYKPPKFIFSPSILFALPAFCFTYLAYRGLSLPYDYPYNVLLARQLSSLNFLFLLVTLASCQGVFGRFLSWSPLVYLGEISFGVYLYHQPLMIRAVQAGGFKFAGIQILPDNLLAISSLTIIIACLSYLFLERPLSVFIKRK
tara:strand:- start:13287 stop:14453 length:1167 start_codon:yes stop_codon:yes gene_type:complete